jgi:2'-5' RNA ligase
VRVQARITLPEALRAPIDALRMRWNPEAATDNPAHATLVYHDEATDPELLRARLEAVCETTAPFRVELGGAAEFRHPARGAFLKLADPSDAVRSLRRRLLAPPFEARTRFGLHVTLLHPAQGERLAEAWPAFAALERPGAFVVESIELIGGAGRAIETLARLALRGVAGGGTL